MSRLAFAVPLVVLLTTPLVATDWPHLRGPAYDGRGPAVASEAPGLELAWRVPLGSGYSGIAASADRAVTMFSEGDSDWVAAFDLGDGAELWRQRLGPINRARDGSADGPISSPVISGDTVYALGPKGQLLALGLSTGEVRWSKRMQDLGASEPHFGFGATPLAVGGRLVILTGVEGSAVTALNPADGAVVWSTGIGEFRYHVPIAMSVGGRNHVVSGVGRNLVGLDAEDGSVLWTHELGEEEGVDAALTVVGDDRFLVSVSGQGAVFEVADGDGEFTLVERFRTPHLGRTYALPVYHEGHIYGFRGQILTCVDAETGERRWRSRPPGGRGLIVLGDYLAVFGADGYVVLVDASPDGYVERARLRALDASGYTWPSYAGGRVLVRNLEELAAVSVGDASAQAMAGAGAVDGAFGDFLRRLETSDDKTALIDEFLGGFESLPILEGDRAHFVYVGEAEDMAVIGSVTPSGGAVGMERVAGTDLFHQTLEVSPAGRWEYQFVRDYQERLADPRNSTTVPPRQGPTEMSEFTTPGYERRGRIEGRADGLQGTIDAWTFDSETLGIERKLSVYLPIGYHESENEYSLLIVHDGGDWLEKGLLNNTLDQTAGNGAQPLVVVFLEPRDEWWREAGGTGTDDHARMVVEELLPLLETRYRIKDDPASRGLMGNTGYALASAYVALKHPDRFGKVALQSPQLTHGFEDALMELIEREPKAEVEFYLDWSRYEVRNLDAGVDLGVDSRRLAEALRAGGYEFVGGEAADSSGWAGWRSRTDVILETLFPVR